MPANDRSDSLISALTAIGMALCVAFALQNLHHAAQWQELSAGSPPIKDPEIAARYNRIQAELKSLPPHHPWAGLYRYKTKTLLVAPKSGYVSWWNTTNKGFRNFHAGDVYVDGDFLLFSGEDAEGKLYDWALVVPWGAQVFLVPGEHFGKFLNSINAGTLRSEADSGPQFYLRDGPRTKSEHGWPELPGFMRGALLQKPINARIMSVGRRYQSYEHSRDYVKILLDVGRRNGAILGMQLIPRGHESSGKAVLTLLSDTNSIAIFMFNRPIKDSPEAGWDMSTRYEGKKLGD